MHVKTTKTGNVFEARLTDRLAFTDNAAFRALLEEMAGSKASNWVFELSELSAVDSAGLGMFIIAMEKAKNQGVQMTLRRPTGHVRNLIELSNMDKLLHVED